MIKAYRRMGSARHFVPLALLMPVGKSVVGIDGGAAFQVIASENLGMSSAAIGLAFGLGVLSLPVQLLAARTPLGRATPNLRHFVALLAVFAATIAVLVQLGPSSPVTLIAIGVAVGAEVALSVLYATSWLPLQNSLLDSTQRQWLSSRVRAVGGLALVALLLAVAAGDTSARTVLIVLVAALAIAVTLGLRAMPTPMPPTPAGPTDARRTAGRFDGRTTWLLVCSGVLGFASWPVFLVYTNEVLWPAANIGAVGALQVVGALLTALLWRPADADLGGRARASGAVLLASTLALCAVPSPIDGNAAGTVVIVATLVGAAALAALQLTLLELVHRTVQQSSAVRVFTVLDVVESTSLQIGLLAGGLLTSLSNPGARVDMYRAALVSTTAAALVLVIMTTRRRHGAVVMGGS